jgi:hypothetical protein
MVTPEKCTHSQTQELRELPADQCSPANAQVSSKTPHNEAIEELQEVPEIGDALATDVDESGQAAPSFLEEGSKASIVLEGIQVYTTLGGSSPPNSQDSADGCAINEGPVSLIDVDGNAYCMEVVDPEQIPGGLCSKTVREPLCVGDHVYQWRSWMGIPGVFQHHGIVMDIQQEKSENQKTEERSLLKLIIADFSNVEHRTKKAPTEPKPSRRGVLTQEGILRTYADTDQWHKVEYQAAWWKRTAYRAGTCTSVNSDAVGLVLARVNYILRNPEVLPDYHVVNANCECVAVWCKTGRWSTLQASSLLELTAAGQAKSTATLAATAASTQVTVQAPATGIWGWLGYTTTSQVSWLSLHPIFVPALAGYAVLSVGVPAVLYVRARQQWKTITNNLKESFWQDAMAHPEVFAECMTHWSDK